MKNKTTLFILLSVLLLQYTGCGIYSFQGAATSAKTIEIADFYNNTDLASANLDQTFTNRLKDYYQRNSSLRVVDLDGELYIEGTITGYQISSRAPVASQSSAPDVAAFSRLTITINVTYKDSAEPKNSFQKKAFSFYEDFANTENIVDIQEDLEEKIFDQILLDIFNATVANW